VFKTQLKKNFSLEYEVQDISRPSNKKECLVSKASREIMLARVCNGTKLEFPFTN
tara:strand:- start:1111 stop:1275 length:165 start_codon:yes stop_codon:yes gene_type:complete